MKDQDKTKQMLIEELVSLRHRISELEQSESEGNRAEETLQASDELFSLYMRHSPIYSYIKEVTSTQSIVLHASDNYRQMIGIPSSEMLGKTMAELFPPEFAAKITADDWAVVYKGGVLKLDEELNGRSYTTIKFPITLGEKTLLAGYTIDITDRKQAEKEKDVLADIGLLIGSTLDIDEVYERFSAKIQKLIPFDSLTINLYNFQEKTMCAAYVSGLDIDGRRKGDPLVPGGSLSEAVIHSRTGLRIQPESYDEIADQFPRLSPIFQAGLRSIMCVPLVSRDEVIGVLHFRSKKPNAYTEQDLRLAERIGMQIAGAIANAQLYTGLKKTEMSLRESEGRFRGLFEQAAVGVAEINMNTGRFLTVNRRLGEMVGRAKEEMLATTFQAITHPEDLHLHEEKTKMMLAGEIRHYSLEKRYLRKDGDIVWVNITVSPLWNLGEAPRRNIAVVEDITDRKRAEEAIRNTQTRYRMLFDHSPDGIVIIDPDTMRPLEFNETAHQQLGYSREEFARLSIPDIDVFETPDEIRSHIQKAIFEGRSDFERIHRTRQGEIRYIHVTAQNIEILGRPVYHCIWRDVTDHKRLDDELILKTRNIEEVNAALKVLLKQVEEGKTDLEGKILSNIRELVLPNVNRLKNTPLSDIQKTILQTTESNLNNITSTFLNSLKIKFYNLTPREIEVATFVREGRSAKEIAALLCLSQKTIELHRGSLRKKLGLRNKKINLRSYLNTIQ